MDEYLKAKNEELANLIKYVGAYPKLLEDKILVVNFSLNHFFGGGVKQTQSIINSWFSFIETPRRFLNTGWKALLQHLLDPIPPEALDFRAKKAVSKLTKLCPSSEKF